jgi:hypothetical protein
VPDEPKEQESDPNQEAFEAVQKITGFDPEEELLGDPELREKYRKFKEEFEKREGND